MNVTINNNAIVLAIILAVCFVASRDRSSSSLLMLGLILGIVLLLYRENQQLATNEGSLLTLPNVVGIGSYGSRN